MCCGINESVSSFNEMRSLLDLYCLLRSFSLNVKVYVVVNEKVFRFNEKCPYDGLILLHKVYHLDCL